MNISPISKKLSTDLGEITRFVFALGLAALLGATAYAVLQSVPSLVELRGLLLSKFGSYQGLASSLAPVIFVGLMVAQVINATLCIIGRGLKSPRQPGNSVFFAVLPVLLWPAVLATVLVMPLPPEEVGNFSLFALMVTGVFAMMFVWCICQVVLSKVPEGPFRDPMQANPVAYLTQSKVVISLFFLASGFTAGTFAVWAGMTALDHLLNPVGKMPTRE